MEYYGKILCISVNDLTYDDRPVVVDGVADWSHSRVLNGRAPQDLPVETLAPIMSVPNYKQLSARKKINVVRRGGGMGEYALIEVATLPRRFRERVTAKYGEMEQNVLRDWFERHYRVDAEARSWFTRFRFADGSPLPPDKINEYTVNASVLQAVVAVMADTNIMRKAMQGTTINWGEMTGVISYFQAEFGHTLPLSPHRFRERVTTFQKQGYESLISKKFKNQSARKVNYGIERLILSLDSRPERPYNTTVAEMYNMFVRGELTVADPETGEWYDPANYTDKNGDPLVLSEATIANYLNTAKNKALRSKLHDTQWDFNNRYRPYHVRRNGVYALSKISLDDRDLPRPMSNGQRVKAYYAYDVVSGCVVGRAYSRLKTTDLFLDCMRDMFQTLDRNGWYMPAELEVEHHLVQNFADGLMKAGVVFPLIRWCNPGNSREKRAEHLNRAKKYGVEKRMQVGIGRWYASLEANRPKVDKVYDELNNTYKEATYTYEQLVADDLAAIETFNHQLHPNQKMYPGMSRWDVLASRQNPDPRPCAKPYLYRYTGNFTTTTIKQNMFCTVQYQQFRLPSPRDIEKLEPRNNKVEAYWLADADGNIGEVYLWQGEKYIATCKLLERYNEATAEQTQADRDAYTEQSKYVSQFDKMMREEKITKVAVIERDQREAVQRAALAAVAVPKVVEQPDDDDDYSDYLDVSQVARAAVASI